MSETNNELDESNEKDEKKSHISRRAVSLGLGALALGLFGSSGYIVYDDHKKNEEIKKNSLKDLDGKPVVHEPGEAPTEEQIKKMDVKDDDSVPFVESENGDFNYTGGNHSGIWVPKVGLSAPLATMSMVDHVINPPGFRRVYFIRNLGESFENRDKGTVYLSTHSIRSGRAPGNALIDVDSGRSTLDNGDEIFVKGVQYIVTDHFTVLKGDLPKTKKVWEIVPGRLVIITCLQRPSGGRSLKNSVIIADLPKPAKASDGGR